MAISTSAKTRLTTSFFTFFSARLSIFAVALLSLVSFSSGHAAEWLNETFEQYTVASPATAPTTLLSPLLQFISSGATVVGTVGNQMCRYYKPTATALVSSSHQYSLSAANGTPRPMGFFSFKIVQNTPPSPAVASSEFYLRLGSNDNTKMSASATAFIDFRFSPSVAPATTCVFSVRSGANVQNVITTVSATAQSTIKTWYNTGSVGMPYFDPAGAAQTLSAGSYVCYVNNVLASSSASGTALVSSVTTGGTATSSAIGKLAFQCAAGSAVDFSVDDIYAADTAPVSGVGITSPTTATAQAGYPFSYTISSDGVTSPVYSTSTLPTGLSLSSGVISGTLSASATQGLNNITLTATGAGGSATGNLALTITAPPAAAPAITSAATASGNLTKTFTYQITTQATTPVASIPTSYAIATGTLPSGLTLNTSTGAITGTPNGSSGVTVMTYTATNPAGTSNPQTLTITINPAPVFAWNNTGTVWTNAASWTNNAVPTETDIAAFGNLGSGAGVTVAGETIGGIIFNPGANAYTWSGSAITVISTNGITNNSTAIQTFNNKVTNSGGSPIWSSVAGGGMVFNGGIDLTTANSSSGRTLTFAGAGNVTVSGVIANGGNGTGTSTNAAVTFSSIGTNLLSGSNTYGGTTTIATNSTLKIGSATALGSTSGSTVVSSGGVLDLNGQTISGEVLTLNGSGINTGGALINSGATDGSWSGTVALGNATTYISASAGKKITLSGAVSGVDKGIYKLGTGTLEVSGTNTYTGQA